MSCKNFYKSGLLGAALIIASCLRSEAQTVEKGPILGDGVFESTVKARNKDIRIFLVKIDGISTRPSLELASSSVVIMDATVLAEYRGSVPEGAKIKIEFDPVISTHQVVVPIGAPIPWQPGTSLMAALATDQPDVFRVAGPSHLIGLKTPCQVNPIDLPLIKPALQKLGEIARNPDYMLPRDQAEKMMDENIENNYYLWALGAKAMAAYNDRAAVRKLTTHWNYLANRPTRTIPSIHHIVWLDFCFDTMSEGVAPSHEWLYVAFRDYLNALVNSTPLATVPTPVSKP